MRLTLPSVSEGKISGPAPTVRNADNLRNIRVRSRSTCYLRWCLRSSESTDLRFWVDYTTSTHGRAGHELLQENSPACEGDPVQVVRWHYRDEQPTTS